MLMKKEEAQAGAQYVYDYVKGIIDKTGPRLPGTEEERQGALLTADIMKGISGKEAVVEEFDLRPFAIIEKLGLRRPIYEQTSVYGHFGKENLPWEKTDRADDLREKYLRV